MKICPACGYADHPMWRARSDRPFCDYTKWETLKYNNEKLAALILGVHPDPYSDGHFIYHITNTGLNVERIELELYQFMGWGRESQERTKRSREPDTSMFERAYFDLIKPDVTLDDYSIEKQIKRT